MSWLYVLSSIVGVECPRLDAAVLAERSHQAALQHEPVQAERRGDRATVAAIAVDLAR
jgi:hypothetical protein